jgi:hypothetical protein
MCITLDALYDFWYEFQRPYRKPLLHHKILEQLDWAVKFSGHYTFDDWLRKNKKFCSFIRLVEISDIHVI